MMKLGDDDMKIQADLTHVYGANCVARCTVCRWIEGFSVASLYETQTAVILTCLPFIRSGQNLLARHSERGEKTRQTEEEVGRQQQGLDRPGVRRVPEGGGAQRKMEETGCKVICGAPTILALKE